MQGGEYHGSGAYILSDESYKILGAVMEVYNHLGPGFVEAVYQEALEIELAARQIPFEAQVAISISYKGRMLRREFVADFVCYGQVIVEIKAIKEITGLEKAQILNYLKATGLPLGLLVNFGSVPLEKKRYANTRPRQGPRQR